MSLMQLLSSGKSWVGLKDSGVRYRMTDPRAMPKFGSDKTRFHTPVKLAPAQVQSPVPTTHSSQAPETEIRIGMMQPQEVFSNFESPSTANVFGPEATTLPVKSEPEKEPVAGPQREVVRIKLTNVFR